ncbi:MAG: tetratricopeptide repeat protein, partial [Bacteroidia bacterium]|nr:tetratricopeptide repeat protein [Bacteroidia bacterium]
MDFKKLNIVIFFFILFFPNQGFPQNQKKIDSLLYTVQTAGNDTIKIAALNSLSNEYSTCNLEKAMQYSKEGLSLALKINNKRKLSACYLNVGFIYRKQGNYPLALEYYQKSLRMDEELGNKKDIVTCYNHIGILQAEQENYSNSLDYFLKAMKLLDDLSKNCRKNKDIVSFKESMANCLLNLGNMKYKLGDLDSTLVYYNKSLALNEELGDKKNMAKCYNNIGNIYYLKNN